jgi:hypothetical protein
MCELCTHDEVVEDEADEMRVAYTALASADAAAKVQRGAAWLDKIALDGVVPIDWHNHVDDTALDMNSTTLCILGQLFETKAMEQFQRDVIAEPLYAYKRSGYDVGLKILWAQDESQDKLGFDGTDVEYANAAWLEELDKRVLTGAAKLLGELHNL